MTHETNVNAAEDVVMNSNIKPVSISEAIRMELNNLTDVKTLAAAMDRFLIMHMEAAEKHPETTNNSIAAIHAVQLPTLNLLKVFIAFTDALISSYTVLAEVAPEAEQAKIIDNLLSSRETTTLLNLAGDVQNAMLHMENIITEELATEKQESTSH